MDEYNKKNIKRKNPLLLIISSIIILILLLGLIDLVINKFNSSYAQLNNDDQQVLAEFDKYCKSNDAEPAWTDFKLNEQTILAVNGWLGSTYLINPRQEIIDVTATEIEMPDTFSLVVYRISHFSPSLIKIKADVGSFNEIGKKYSVLDEDVYFTKYDVQTSMQAPNSSRHFITFLAHESFHYYMQNNWADGSRFTGDLSTDDLELLSQEYDVLAEIQAALLEDSETPSHDELLEMAKKYVKIVSERLEQNPQYTEKELAMETCEGTATYIGIKASEDVHYDYGVMYFDNVKNVSFSEVIPMLNSGTILKSFLADRMPYETGAQLCLFLDALEVDGWQEKFNKQHPDNPVTLYAIISDYVNEN